MTEKVYVVGVGMTKFEKPGRRENWDYPDMARESGTNALADAGIDFSEVEQGFVGYVYGESTSGQRALYELGLSRNPDRQREQQLLDGVDRAVHGRAGHPRGSGRLHDRAGLRENEARLAGSDVGRSHQPDGQADRGPCRDCRVRVPAGTVDVRGGRAAST